VRGKTAKSSDKEKLCETFHQTPSGRDNADEEQVRLELGCPTHTHTLGGDLQNKSKAKHSRAQKSQGQDVNLLVLAVLPFVCRS
jgi:hypothetical protein